MIIDGDLKPWLLEVNASPSLSANTKEDYSMKCEMLNGMLDVVDMEQVLRGDEEHVSGECTCVAVLLYCYIVVFCVLCSACMHRAVVVLRMYRSPARFT